MLEIDGSMGEGGGQVLRSSLALSVITQTPVRLTKIRAGRRKPGLARQHLTAVRAAATISGATVRGDALRSTTLEFDPQGVYPGHHHFDVGTAGSTTLVLQTILWPLLLADGPSVVTIDGGTHNPLAPPFEFVDRCFGGVLHRMGAEFDVALEVPGFYPAGGGRIVAKLQPSTLVPIELHERGDIVRRHAIAIVSNLPLSVAQRELAVVEAELGWLPGELEARRVHSPGPGNALMLELMHGAGATVVSAIGEKGVRAERVAAGAAEELRRFEAADIPVDDHLADQLLIPLALAGGGSFRTLTPTLHTRTNADLIGRFLPVEFDMRALPDGSTRVDLRKRPSPPSPAERP